MHRRWRVRHSYPRPVVDLVELLMSQHPVPQLARVLDLPMSVIYRWRARKFARPEHESPRASGETIATLLAQCELLGFRFTKRLSGADRPEWLSIEVARRELGEDVPSIASPLSLRGKGAGDAAVPIHDTAVEETHPTRSPACARDRVAVRLRKTSQAVTHRLEAARRLIDAEYFSHIDSKLLADAARMSRHHFIRMFSGAFGISPHQYLTRKRIGAAKRLLISSREPIEVIAAGVGFRSGPSLNRAFKQIEGASVSQFCMMMNRPASVSAVPQPMTVAVDHVRLQEK